MTEIAETLGDFVCPICGNKYFSDGEICPHKVIDMLNAQAAEIIRLRSERDYTLRIADALTRKFSQATELAAYWENEAKQLDHEIRVCHARISEISPSNPGEALIDAIDRVYILVNKLRG